MVSALVWAMIMSHEAVLLTILGYMAADLIGQEVVDAYKVNKYVEGIRQDQGDSRNQPGLNRSDNIPIVSSKRPTK